MYERVEDSKENKSRSVADSIQTQTNTTGQGFNFENNRRETIVQRKLENAISGRNIQRIKIGKESITTVTDLGAKMGLSEDEVIKQFNDALGPFPKADKGKINNFLSAKTSKVRTSITNHKEFFRKLVIPYKKVFMQTQDSTFMGKMNKIESEDDYKDLMDKDGINYGKGADDGASIEDSYKESLACTLFAILKLKPGFLGAKNAEELHYILRTNPKTKNYDDDPKVAQIRLSAGLKYKDPKTDLSGFMSGLDKSKKFIIDPDGQAHTFALVHDGTSWKHYDNHHTDGKAPSNTNIRVVWE